MTLWKRIADRILPDSVFQDFGKVNWRIHEPSRSVGVRTICAPILVSASLLNLDPFTWYSPRGTVWKRWPVSSFDAIMLNDLAAAYRVTP